jgi:hypothetical protein
MNANCDVLLTSAGVKGCTLDVTTATIITVSMADVSSTSSTTDDDGCSDDKRNNKKSLPKHEDNGFKP